MGCCLAGGQSQVGRGPRRRSAGSVDLNVNEGLLSLFHKLTVIDLLKARGEQPRLRATVSSSTDHNRQPFRNKAMLELGDKINPEPEGIGYVCRKGLKPWSLNQDSWFVLRTDTCSIYAVFDGHGKMGHEVSEFAKEVIPKLILLHTASRPSSSESEVHSMFRDVFRITQSLIRQADRDQRLSAQMSGTTATVCIHDMEQHKISVAHVADSTCVLGKASGHGIQVTRGHKPNLAEERARIEKSGGRVSFDGYAHYRVYAKKSHHPGLNMSRCLGDLMGHSDCGLAWEPEVYQRKLEPDDQVLLLCSDGVWEFISPTEAVNFVLPFGPKKSMQAAEHLAKQAWRRWIREEGGDVVDDITVLLVSLQGRSGIRESGASLSDRVEGDSAAAASCDP